MKERLQIHKPQEGKKVEKQSLIVNTQMKNTTLKECVISVITRKEEQSSPSDVSILMKYITQKDSVKRAILHNIQKSEKEGG